MSRCKHCKSDIFWAMRESGNSFMRPLEAKGEALIPEPGEVVIDLVDGEWRAVPVPTVRLHKIHECAGMPQPRTGQPRPAVRSEPARPSVVFHDTLSEYEDDNEEVMVVVQQRSKPPVPGAWEIARQRRADEAIAERARRHEKYWATPGAIERLQWSCPKCRVGVGERCISVSKNVDQWGKPSNMAHPERKSEQSTTAQYEKPVNIFEFGADETELMVTFLSVNSNLFGGGK